MACFESKPRQIEQLKAVRTSRKRASVKALPATPQHSICSVNIKSLFSSVEFEVGGIDMSSSGADVATGVA
jgi:hypothetical protein